MTVFLAEFFCQTRNTHTDRQLAGITEADQHWPDSIQQTLFFRPEAIPAASPTTFPDVQRMKRYVHTQSHLTSGAIFEQDGYSAPAGHPVFVMPGRNRVGSHLVLWSARRAGDGRSSPGNQKRCHMAVLYPLPETDLFIHIQLTPVLRIVRITHLHSPCRCFWRPDTSVWLRSESGNTPRNSNSLGVKKSQQLNSNPMSRQQIQNLFQRFQCPDCSCNGHFARKRFSCKSALRAISLSERRTLFDRIVIKTHRHEQRIHRSAAQNGVYVFVFRSYATSLMRYRN